MSINKNEFHFDDIQDYRDEYIRQMNQHDDKTTFAITNADSLYAMGLTMYSREYSFASLVYNAFATSALDNNISLHPEQRKVLGQHRIITTYKQNHPAKC